MSNAYEIYIRMYSFFGQIYFLINLYTSLNFRTAVHRIPSVRCVSRAACGQARRAICRSRSRSTRRSGRAPTTRKCSAKVLRPVSRLPLWSAGGRAPSRPPVSIMSCFTLLSPSLSPSLTPLCFLSLRLSSLRALCLLPVPVPLQAPTSCWRSCASTRASSSCVCCCDGGSSSTSSSGCVTVYPCAAPAALHCRCALCVSAPRSPLSSAPRDPRALLRPPSHFRLPPRGFHLSFMIEA